MTVTVLDLIGLDLGGYKLAVATVLELDHKLMGCFPAVFKEPKEEIAVFVNDLLLEAAAARLDRRPYRARHALFLLDYGGASGFILQGNNPCAHTRSRVYTQHDHDTGVAIGWAPGLI